MKDEIEEIFDKIEEKKLLLKPQITELDNKITKFTNWAWAFVYLGIGIVVFGVCCYIFPNIIEKLTLNELGDFYAGSVASSWSLAGLFFIYVAFLGQKQQLINQQIELLYNQGELKATRIELSGQKEQLLEQNRTFKQQRFENTFFQLLSNHAEIISSIDLRKKNPTTRAFEITSQGRDCIKVFYERFEKGCRVFCHNNGLLEDEIDIKDALKEYMSIYHSNQADLGHYFRNMYHILKFISEEAKMDNNGIINKKRYSNLLRAQLSSYELALLFYNGIGDYGIEKFKDYIIEFDFLKNLDKDLIISKKHLKMYPKKAIGL